METKAVSLQDKIQRLIDQYSQDKQKLDKLEEENANLKEENSQLMAQIESMNSSHSGSDTQIKELEQQVKTLESKYQELQKTIAGFEDIASDAISKIDSIFPDLDSNNKK